MNQSSPPGAPSIRSYLVATAFPVVLAGALLTAAAVATFAFFYLRASQAESLHLQARTLAEAVATPVANGDRESATETLGWWKSATDLQVVAAYDQERRLLATVGGSTTAPSSPPFSPGAEVDFGALRLVEPVRLQGVTIGFLYLEMGFASLYRNIAALIAAIAALTALAVLVIRVVLGRAGERIAQPISDLVAVATEVSRHPELTKRAGTEGPREVAELAHTFNNMLDTLQREAAKLDCELRERQRTEALLDRLAHYDSVTGLANRVHFHNELPRAAERARRQRHNIALVYLDLDDFKVVNDTLGHHVGDALLKLVGERLAGVLRKGDFVYRLGGDEFTVILENIQSLHSAVEVVTKLIERLSSTYSIGEHSLHVGVSAGIALFPEQTEDLADLLRYADIAMYQAKAAGKNDYCIYTSDLTSRANFRLAIENEMRRGIERDEFFLKYQPQVDLVTGRIVGFEALVRWQHPERGVIAPGYFIDIAEQSGLIVPLGKQIVAKACREWARWRDHGADPPRLAVNVSGRQLDEASFVDDMMVALTAVGRPRPKIDLEITETLLLSDTRVSRSMLHRLAGAGIGWSLDDFGTGYSSLTYLSKFPISKIKIDQSFVARLPGDGNSEAIVRAVLGMAGGLGMEVVIEGIETREQADYLVAMGGRIGQGYLFHRPLAGDQALALLLGQASPAA